MNDSGETHNYWGLYTRCTKKISTGEVRDVMRDLKETLGTGTPSMDDTLRDSFTVKLSELFNQVVILK